MIKSYLFSSLCILLIPITFASCKKDKDLIPVSSYLRDMIPYKSGQIVKFKGTNNVIITTKVEIKEGVELCTSCQPNEKRQVVDYILRNTASVDYSKVATLGIIDRAENLVFLTVYNPFYDFFEGNGFDFNTVNKTSQFFTDNSKFILHQNISIGGKTYANVLQINFLSPSLKKDDLIAVYYSKEKGIIKFDHQNGTFFELID